MLFNPKLNLNNFQSALFIFQILAVYDRFGRLIHGNEQLPKDVLEYVVFEKHLSNKYGKWRIHDKIIPSWMPPKEPSRKTHIISE